MSLSQIKFLVENYSTVCRFCLQSNAQELSSLYEQIAGKSDIVTINTTIRNVLTMLGIQIAQNDLYPNLICCNCRDLLQSVQIFRETVQKTTQLFDQARLLKEFPNAKFDEDPPEEIILKEQNILENAESLDVAYEVLVASNEEDTVAETVDGVKVKLEVVKYEPNISGDYTETEWIEYDKSEESEQQQTDETEDIYIDEEYIQEMLSEDDQESTNIEETEILQEEELINETEAEEESAEQIKSSSNKNCPICGVTSTAMAVHIRTHTKIRPFTCGTCEKKFYTNAKLRSHIEAVHIGERKFSCEICGKAFVLRKTLNTHMMSHVAEKAFVCSVCSKGFLFRWALTKHERVHTGERPYVCTLDGCGKKFATSSNLNQHQKTNTHWKNPREDICHECGKSFQNKYALRAHQKTHHSSKLMEKNE